MLARKSDKVHLEFDLAQARRIYTEAKVELRAGWIVSPYELYSVEALRDTYGLRIGQAVPTDIFVFGKGEPPRPDTTRIGGLPYWPAGRPWPTTRKGSPYYFLAQFNFADSRDLVGDLPGDVLLVFLEDPEEYWTPEHFHFEWLPMGLSPAREIEEARIAVKGGPFFGVVYRTADYPDSWDQAFELHIGQSYTLPILEGTKIGGLPRFIQSGDDEGDGKFLCQLGSIQAAPNVPYPWVNQEAPLALDFSEDGIYHESNEFCLGDMGSIYVFMEPDGRLVSWCECY